ncbi:hypothetical protein AWH62_05455 [Maricaulis sp. W15]|uniref:hypothetical protein n=1 Tax=Maricaulis sp. W15 TaxID=1772333 RepID=UPI000948B550|nr:hypothetical protein [Maricaulis sp. W15]OLF75268.1 hypothetical protein AWH62_05455 [Maricaulis sp. W15]
MNATLAFAQLCDKLRLVKGLSINDAREIAQAFYRKLAEGYRSPPPPPEPDAAPPCLFDQQEEIARLTHPVELRHSIQA